MPRSIKFGLYAILALILGAVLYAVTLFMITDPETYRGFLEDRISASIDREVNIEGPVHWSFYPVLGVKIHDIKISNPKGFQQSRLAELKQIHAGIKTVPFLLKQKIQFHHIVVKQGELNLIKHKDGNNWQSIIAQFEKAEEKGKHKQQTEHQLVPNIQRIAIEDLTINWIDRAREQTISVKDIDLEVHGFQLATPYKVKLDFALHTDNYPATQWHLQGSVDPKPEKQIHIIHNFQGKVAYLNTKLHLSATGNLTLKKLITDPALKGELTWTAPMDKLAKVYKQPLLKSWGKKLKLTTRLRLDAKGQSLKVTQGKLGKHRFTGHLIHNSQPLNEIQLQLDLNQLDLSPLTKQANKTQGQRSNKLPIPPHWLSENHTDIDIQIDRVRGPMVINNFQLQGHSYHNRFKLTHIRAYTLNGNISGHADLAFTGHRWRVQGIASLRKINLAMAMKTFGGDADIQGHAFTTIHFRTHGHTYSALMNNIRANGSLVLLQGRIEKLRLHGAVQKALGHVDLSQYAKRLPDKAETKYKKVEMNYELVGNQIKNTDISVNTEYLIIHGRGNFVIDDQQIRYIITVAPDFLPGLKIPITVSGPVKDPDIDINFARLVKIYIQEFVHGVAAVGKTIVSGIAHLIP